MSLITTSQKIAAQIDSINAETLSYLQAQAKRVYALANTDGDQQAIMDAFGTQAVAAISTYATIYGALATLGQAGELTAPDLTVFVPQEDGSVLYVAPPAPAPAPELEPEP
jgi:hypothetical protein